MGIRAIANQRILYKKFQEPGSQFEVDEKDVQRMLEAKFICTLECHDQSVEDLNQPPAEDFDQPTELESSPDESVVAVDETDNANEDNDEEETTSINENTEPRPDDMEMTESIDFKELEEKEKEILEKANQLSLQEKELTGKEKELRNRMNLVVQKEKALTQREVSVAYTKSILGIKKPFMNPIVRKGII